MKNSVLKDVKEDKDPKKSNRKALYLIIGIIILTAIGTSSYFYIQYRNAQKLLKQPAATSQEEVGKIVAKVGSLIELPKNEDPTIATVSNKEKLKDQVFFTNAQNGDKVLIYTKSKKAIIYRPSINKIIEVSSVNFGASPTPTSVLLQTPTPTPKLGISRAAVYNGTKIKGLASSVSSQLTDAFKNINIVEKGNTKNDYTKTIIIDLSGKNKNIVRQIADFLSGEVSVLPENEAKPDADILVITGR